MFRTANFESYHQPRVTISHTALKGFWVAERAGNQPSRREIHRNNIPFSIFSQLNIESPKYSSDVDK
jgi:hypothetical protein